MTSPAQKTLLCLAAVALLAALGLKRVSFSETGTIVVGLVEVVVAIALGVALGLSTRHEDA